MDPEFWENGRLLGIGDIEREESEGFDIEGLRCFVVRGTACGIGITWGADICL